MANGHQWPMAIGQLANWSIGQLAYGPLFIGLMPLNPIGETIPINY